MQIKPQKRVQAPAGTYGCVCVDVVERGEKVGQYGTYESISLIFETPHNHPDYGDKLTIGTTFAVGFGKKSRLRTFLESWTNADLSKGISDTEKLVGKPALLTVRMGEYEGEPSAEINTISPIPDGMPVPTPSGSYKRIKDVDGGWDVRSPNSTAPKPASQEGAAQVMETVGAESSGGGSFGDDDLPFGPTMH